jgi:raffinose/stachyose/melibiose transport system permease protein
MSLKFRQFRKNSYTIYFVLPAFIFIFLFIVLSNGLNFVYSFTDWNAFKTEINFVGLSNFSEMAGEGILLRDILTTVKYAISLCIISNLAGLALALALEKTTRVNGIFRTIFFIPVLISSLATGFMFKGILGMKGLINQLFSFIGLTEFSINPLGNINFVIFVIALVHTWKWLGLTILIYVAGLNTIPKELIEAAEIEGASLFQIIKNIKIPLLGPAFTFNIATSLIGALSVFDLVLALTRGGPARASEVINIFIFKQFFSGRFGYATSMSLVLFILIIIVAVPLIIYLRKREVEL